MYNWKASDLGDGGIFPWEDVFKSNIIETDSCNYKPCLKCVEENIEAEKRENIITLNFSSPPWTWERLCGRAGYLTICIKHKVQVDFECNMMN